MPPTITTIPLQEDMWLRRNKNLYVSELGEVVNSMMKEAFPNDCGCELPLLIWKHLLDGVEEGNVNWKIVVSNFYPDLNEAVEQAEKQLEQVQIADEESDEECELAAGAWSSNMVPTVVSWPVPDSRNAAIPNPILKRSALPARNAVRILYSKRPKRARYYGCIGNPKCDFMVAAEAVQRKCPQCGSLMLEKEISFVCYNEDCGYIMEKKSED